MPITTMVGSTINQSTSAERVVNGVGRPPQIWPKTLIRPALIRALVTSTTPPNSTGWLLAAVRASNSRRAAKLANGGKPIRPPAPTRKAMPIRGRLLQSPPSWVRSWVTLLITIVPITINSRAIGRG